MPKTQYKNHSAWPLALSIASILLLPILFYAALANVEPLNTAPGVFAVAAIPTLLAIVTLVVNSHNTKYHNATIMLCVLSLVLSTVVQMFFVGSAILWSAG